MNYMAGMMDDQIEGSISENERLRRENSILRGLLDEVSCVFTMDDDSPGNLLARIDKALVDGE